jgi:hypothetical protein
MMFTHGIRFEVGFGANQCSCGLIFPERVLEAMKSPNQQANPYNKRDVVSILLGIAAGVIGILILGNFLGRYISSASGVDFDKSLLAQPNGGKAMGLFAIAIVVSFALPYAAVVSIARRFIGRSGRGR